MSERHIVGSMPDSQTGEPVEVALVKRATIDAVEISDGVTFTFEFHPVTGPNLAEVFEAASQNPARMAHLIREAATVWERDLGGGEPS